MLIIQIMKLKDATFNKVRVVTDTASTGLGTLDLKKGDLLYLIREQDVAGIAFGTISMPLIFLGENTQTGAKGRFPISCVEIQVPSTPESPGHKKAKIEDAKQALGQVTQQEKYHALNNK